MDGKPPPVQGSLSAAPFDRQGYGPGIVADRCQLEGLTTDTMDRPRTGGYQEAAGRLSACRTRTWAYDALESLRRRLAWNLWAVTGLATSGSLKASFCLQGVTFWSADLRAQD